MTQAGVHLWSQIPSLVLPKPKFLYSPVVKAGEFIFVSGLVGLDPHTGQLAEGGLIAQTRQVLSNFRALCREQGWSSDHLMLVRIYCTEFDRFSELNSYWDEFFKDIRPPARTSVGVSALPLNALVEMEFQLVATATA
ncbi:RidA family protein [Ectopseudomonas mendocina]|uniref:RidA family protein n=1 Tax=Ectopseudomonas mendocina TaxID=300 RepID=A0ABZ2RLI8_ECTME